MTIGSNRGIGANKLDVDEAAFVLAAMIYKVILPLLLIQNTVLVAISTPDKSSNYFSRLLGIRKKDNTRLVKVIHPQTPVCNLHKRQRKEKECECFADVPHFHSSEARELTRAIAPKEIMERELDAMIGEDGSSLTWRAWLIYVCVGMHLFDTNTLQLLFDANVTHRVSIQEPASVIFIGIDPTAGSANKACLAMVAITLQADGLPVVSVSRAMSMIRFLIVFGCIASIYRDVSLRMPSSYDSVCREDRPNR